MKQGHAKTIVHTEVLIRRPCMTQVMKLLQEQLSMRELIRE